ncbi:hypothetical protein HYH02_012573 [Chlamydomonas schloesseri]|uniref:DDE-1 domain-containing protein n=1 Tax=Chlamydomonas schloesseri TaxID=2026947 RepID=A0A835VZI1_9CHLO|nr:hypothetical protein HYH02_012573 [Chlamydomonas schloesseri]|eukprot:KAG2433645.1 hypothetical protein HYH02_012573 [Chlamydomonas schloesseri]
MAEVLHRSHRAGIQGPLLDAPAAVHPVVAPRETAAGCVGGAWVPPSPNPHLGFAHDPGARHKQAGAFAGAADAFKAARAAEAADDHPDNVGRAARRRTPTGPAAPYQKEAAQRAAERAIRPWDPAAGLGERQGAAALALAGANAGPGAFADPAAPSLYAAPGQAEANAHAAAAGRVARRGQDQAGSVGAYSVREGAPARELWPVNLAAPQKYCTACRGDHDDHKVANPAWQPYTPATRLANLQLLDTKFRRALFKGLLCCGLSDSYWDPVRWSEQPRVMSADTFAKQLQLAFDGIRDGHEPHRFLATQAVTALLDCPGRAAQVAAAAPGLVGPLKLCLNTMQPQLVGGALLLLRKLLRAHPAAGAALGPYLRHLLPALAVFKGHTRVMELPAPVCLPPTGSWAGGSAAATTPARARCCAVCGAPTDREAAAAAARAAAEADLAVNAARLGAAGAADPDAVLPPGTTSKRLPGRVCGRYTLAALIDEVLGLMVAAGGELGRRQVRSYIPSFNYFTPQDAPPCVTVEELRQAAETARGPAPPSSRRRSPNRRPATALSGGGGGGAVPVPGGTSSSSAAGARPRSAGAVPGRVARGGGGKGAAGSRKAKWDSGPAVDKRLLSYWDGIEFRDQPVGSSWGGAGGGDDTAGGQVSSGYGVDDATSAVGARDGLGRPHVYTPVPVFDSPHDPLYRALREEADGWAEALRHSVTFAHAGPEVGRKGGAVRGGVGGEGGGVTGGISNSAGSAERRNKKKVNVNAEVPYKASPSGIRLAWPGFGPLLLENGGKFKVSTSWINNTCRNMGLSMRRATTSAQKLPKDWEHQGTLMLLSATPSRATWWTMDNMDQTGIHLLPTRGISRAPVGAKRVALVDRADKRQITAVLAASLSGNILPTQLIFQGKTKQSLPSEEVRKKPEFKGWDFTCTTNHWASLATMKAYVTKVLVPYFNAHKRSTHQSCVLMLDCWSVHRSQAFRDWMRETYPWIKLLYVPTGCTGVFQLMDVAMNCSVKCGVQRRAQEYLSATVTDHLEAGKALQDVKGSELEGGVDRIGLGLGWDAYWWVDGLVGGQTGGWNAYPYELLFEDEAAMQMAAGEDEESEGESDDEDDQPLSALVRNAMEE